MLSFATAGIGPGIDNQDIRIRSIGDPEFISVEHVIVTCKENRVMRIVVFAIESDEERGDVNLFF